MKGAVSWLRQQPQLWGTDKEALERGKGHITNPQSIKRGRKDCDLLDSKDCRSSKENTNLGIQRNIFLFCFNPYLPHSFFFLLLLWWCLVFYLLIFLFPFLLLCLIWSSFFLFVFSLSFDLFPYSLPPTLLFISSLPCYFLLLLLYNTYFRLLLNRILYFAYLFFSSSIA